MDLQKQGKERESKGESTLTCPAIVALIDGELAVLPTGTHRARQARTRTRGMHPRNN